MFFFEKKNQKTLVVSQFEIGIWFAGRIPPLRRFGRAGLEAKRSEGELRGRGAKGWENNFNVTQPTREAG